MAGEIAEAVAGLVGGLNNSVLGWANFNEQKKNNKYQKELQKQIFEREDNAWQRAIADIKSAGLSPTVLTGGAGTGGIVGTSAPQFSGSGIGAVLDGIQAVQQMEQTKATTKQIKESTRTQQKEQEKLDKEIDKIDNDMKLQNERQPEELSKIRADTAGKVLSNDMDAMKVSQAQELVNDGYTYDGRFQPVDVSYLDKIPVLGPLAHAGFDSVYGSIRTTRNWWRNKKKK